MEAIRKMLRNREERYRRQAQEADEYADSLQEQVGQARDSAADARAEADELARVRIAMYGADEEQKEPTAEDIERISTLDANRLVGTDWEKLQ